MAAHAATDFFRCRTLREGASVKDGRKKQRRTWGLTHKSSHPRLCSEVADGVTRNTVSLFREPDAVTPPVRFDEREQETEPSQTGLRRRSESPAHKPPGG